MGPRSNKSSLGLKSLIYFDSDVVTARHGHQCMRWFYFFCLFQSSRYGTVDGNINIQPLYKFSIKTFDSYILRWKDCPQDISSRVFGSIWDNCFIGVSITEIPGTLRSKIVFRYIQSNLPVPIPVKQWVSAPLKRINPVDKISLFRYQNIWKTSAAVHPGTFAWVDKENGFFLPKSRNKESTAQSS